MHNKTSTALKAIPQQGFKINIVFESHKFWHIDFSRTNTLSKPRSTLYIPALTLPFSSVFFDSFSITLLYSRRRGSWLWHSPVNTNTAIICVMGVSLNLTTPIKFSLTLINTDVHCILCKVYNRVDSSNITSQTWIFYFFRFFSQKTETEFWLLYIKIPKSDYLYKYALGNLKS